eukprot:CAMPEP_0177668636 /NCGR_PEP_ID=MMETSP0447-20121125/22903_1 /TAXON_ID=0 /ORGANISM="Stygamoeba regulata, Strain BSH-02190019" /LENGTH=286 /DNA_ID=CAMNT_0019175229 /DNA_START=190 /DNA_END=1050 /DNA_ORIENTATION=+
MDALSNLPLSELFSSDFQLLKLSDQDKLGDATAKLVEKNVYSAPVCSADGAVLGLLGLSDVVHLLLQVSYDKFASVPLIEAMNVSKVNDFRTLKLTDSIAEAVKILCNVDRIVVVDDKNCPTHMISKMTVIQYLGKNPKALGDFGNKTLGESGLYSKPVKGIKGSLSVRSAFQFLLDHRIGGVAYYDTTGHVLGNVSVKDVKHCFGACGEQFLEGPVDKFINHIRASNLRAVHPTIHVSHSDTIIFVIQKFASVKIHRMFTKETGEERTIGLVSLGDILRGAATLL